MKKLLIVLLAVVLAVPAFQACKKGKNDPAISLKSRKARLVGEWRLEEGTITITLGSNTQVITYNGSTASYSTGGSVSYTQTVTVNKDDTWESNEMNDGDLTVQEGQWYFMGDNKDNEIKNKECVGFVITRQTFTPAGGSASIYSASGVTPDFVWRLDKLSSKEIIVTFKYVETGSTTYSRTGTVTYTKK